MQANLIRVPMGHLGETKGNGVAKKSRKSGKTAATTQTDEAIVDAEVLEETADADVATPEELERALSEDVDAAATNEEPEPSADAEPAPDDATEQDVETPADDTPELTEDSAETSEIEPLSQSEPPVAEPAPAPAAEPAKAPSVFIPMLLGGLVAGLAGYGFAYMQYANQGPSVTPDELAAVEARIAELPPPTDISGLTEDVASVQATIEELGLRIDETVGALEDRIGVLERQPNADGTLTDTAMAAFEADMQALRDQLTTMTGQTAEQLAATQAAAQAVQDNAVEAAKRATGRAALARVQGALETGEPFAALLPELESALGGAVPAAISDVSGGVATLASLQTGFPELARDALSVSRAEGVGGEEGGGLGAFLSSQLNVRSTRPQEGDSVDAILSRVEAAVSEGRLNDALAEAAGLPDVAKGALSEWLTQAEARAAALDAAETLATSLSDN